MSKNYYDILGISPDIKQKDIRIAAQAKANEINDAFATLIDPEKRNAYDEQLHALSQQSVINSEEADLTQETSFSKPIKIESTSQPPLSSPFKKQEYHHHSKWTQRWKLISEKFTTIETPSIHDIIIFITALAFFAYMVSGFFISPSIERDEARAAQMQKYQGR